MEKLVYVVNAYKFGEKANHSYTVGVRSKKLAALKLAEKEEKGEGIKIYV